MSVFGKLLDMLMQLGVAIGAILTVFNYWLHVQLQELGVPSGLQTALPLAVTALVVVGSLRLLNGLVRVVIVLFLLAAAYHMALPPLQS